MAGQAMAVGGSSAPIGQATDRAGTAMSTTASPSASSGSDGGGGSSDASISNAAASTGGSVTTSGAAAPNAEATASRLKLLASVDTPSATDNGSNEKIIESVNRDAAQSPGATAGDESAVVTSQFTAAELLSVAGHDADGPTIELATTTDARGEGRFLITGKILQAVANESELQLYSVHEGRIRSLGEAVLDDSDDGAGTFRAVGIGKINSGDEVILHVAPADGSMGLVSPLYQVRSSEDADRDGVSGELESLAAGDVAQVRERQESLS